MAETSLPVEHLFDITADTGPAMPIGAGPIGNRAIIQVTGGTFEGPKMKGTIAPNSGGDWVAVRADGSVKLDVRITLQTHDGANIYMFYRGIGVRSEGGLVLRTAPYFETGDARYAWLNNVQGVATGAPGDGNVEYHVYALKF